MVEASIYLNAYIIDQRSRGWVTACHCQTPNEGTRFGIFFYFTGSTLSRAAIAINWRLEVIHSHTGRTYERLTLRLWAGTAASAYKSVSLEEVTWIRFVSQL